MKELVINNVKIYYNLTRKNVKNINFRVKENYLIQVSANKNVSIKEIEKLIIKNADFFLKGFNQIENLKKHKITNGSEVGFLGKKYIIQFVESNKNSVEINNKIIVYYKNAIDYEKIYNQWVFEQCETIFKTLIDKTYLIFKNYNINYPELKIKTMKSKWGSANIVKFIITLNTKLIEENMDFIEYVVLHEFAHFIHPNHSKDFYNFIEKLMPDYKIRKNLYKKSMT